MEVCLKGLNSFIFLVSDLRGWVGAVHEEARISQLGAPSGGRGCRSLGRGLRLPLPQPCPMVLAEWWGPGVDR